MNRQRKLRRVLSVIVLILMTGGAGFFISNLKNPSFETLSAEEMQQRIITERDFAIQKAVEVGVYKCCINPPCTMCYMEANPWNDFQAGTCACDDLIAQGKEPCPQCKSGLCESTPEGICQ